MIFQSRWHNARYVVRKSDVLIIPGVGKEVKWGLVAKFRGPNRLFDSELAQATNGWTDEEREQVERHLLGSEDFGQRLHLAPGEEMPEDKIQFVKNKSALEQAVRKCGEIWYANGDLRQCQNPASVGIEFCDEHRKDKSKIVQGVLTTFD